MQFKTVGIKYDVYNLLKFKMTTITFNLVWFPEGVGQIKAEHKKVGVATASRRTSSLHGVNLGRIRSLFIWYFELFSYAENLPFLSITLCILHCWQE